MEWNFGCDIDDLVVPEDQEISDRLPLSPGILSKWGTYAPENFVSPNKYFNMDTNSIDEDFNFNGFCNEVDIDASIQDKGHSSGSSTCAGLSEESLQRTTLSRSMALAMATSFANSSLFSKTSLFIHINALNRLAFCVPFSSTSTFPLKKKWRPPVASALELGGVQIAKDDIVRDDPTNNVPDTIFAKLGMQLHRRNQHPLGILKNAIYEYFDSNYPNKFNKFDDLCPIVSVKQNFDDVLVPADHVSRSYNDTYYIDSQTVLRCHTSAHQAELLKEHTHFLVTGDVYRRDSIDSTHYPVFHQMEGVSVFDPDEWEAAGLDATEYAAKDLKKCLEGLARHLFGAVEMRWVDTYFPFTNPSYELEIYFKEKWLEVLGCGVTEQEILKRSGKLNNVAWAFGLGLERLAMVLFDIPDIRLFWSSDERFTSQFCQGQLGVKFKPFSKYPPCYKDMSFWISESFTENNLCEVVRGVAGDLVEEVRLIDNFTNKKGVTSHCYRIAYRSMERSLTDEEINDLQWNVREQVESKLNVVLR